MSAVTPVTILLAALLGASPPRPESVVGGAVVRSPTSAQIRRSVSPRTSEPVSPLAATKLSPKRPTSAAERRRLRQAAFAFDVASLLPLASMIRSGIGFDRARDRVDAWRREQPSQPVAPDLLAEHRRQRDLVMGTAIAILVIGGAAAALHTLGYRERARRRVTVSPIAVAIRF